MTVGQPTAIQLPSFVVEPDLTVLPGCCKQTCMTHVVSVRMPSDKVAAMDRRATESGLDRTAYLLRLVDQDLARPARKPKRRFRSLHLLGRYRSRGSTNAQVRAALQAQSEKDR